MVILLALLLLCHPAAAAFIDFENCMPQGVQNSKDPRILQFEPLKFWASFDRNDPDHALNVTAYGNITGVATNSSYPAWNDPSWLDDNDSLGKIVDLSKSNNKYSTLFTSFSVLSYTQYEPQPSRFCDSAVGRQMCPLIPAFNGSVNDVHSLPAFSVAHNMNSTYAFTSISVTLRATSGEASNADLACVSATVTPELGKSLRDLLTYLPLVILLSVGFATIFAAVFSPWGSLDTFHWTSNWGRDEDLLRLITPGFADCLQYIQFIVLTGSLGLNYPGFFRPAVSSVAWSVLMFNQSLVSGTHAKSIQDGIYVVDQNDRYGLDQMSQLVGIGSVRDIWAGMMVWLLVIIAGTVALIQLGFVARWAYRQVTSIPREDLRKKNLPFTAGNIIRIVFNYFLLPLVSLSMFQLVVAPQGPVYSVALAVLVLAIVVGFAVWLTYLIAKIKPRSFLFDDLPTVLTYGPLYNTYSDDAATFTIIQIFINVLRGIAIGAVQPSGIAQLVLLAICEIILGLTINAIRPYPGPTSMNVYHTFFAILRAIIIFLSVTFVPSLGVSEAPRGWIGYVILLLHAVGLVFGFFLNALQTVVEVVARLAGAGGSAGGATRGGLAKVFGMRQLQRRVSRHDTPARHNMASPVVVGAAAGHKSMNMSHGRVPSLTASSAALLNRGAGSEARSSMHDAGSGFNAYHRASHSGQFTPNTPEGGSTFSKAASGHRISGSPTAVLALKQQQEASDPYFRAPRPRRNTGDLVTSPVVDGHVPEQDRAVDEDVPLGPSISGRATPIQAQLNEGDFDAGNQRFVQGTNSDYYASREVDYYYGVRGPALRSSGTRRLKTGPADPTGPVSSATGWFKNLFPGKTKEKGKGFEVVRSARAPPGAIPAFEGPMGRRDIYHDTPPEGQSEVGREMSRGIAPEAGPGPYRHQRDISESERYLEPYSDEPAEAATPGQQKRQSTPPSLPTIDVGGAIELPSRVGSRSSATYKSAAGEESNPPFIPRRSSKRKSQFPPDFPSARLAPVAGSPPNSGGKIWSPGHKQQSSSASSRLPFGTGSRSNRYSTGAESLAEGDEDAHATPFFHGSDHGRQASLSPNLMEDRPESMGYVAQHRASDNIRQVSGFTELEGSSAEFVGGPRGNSFRH